MNLDYHRTSRCASSARTSSLGATAAPRSPRCPTEGPTEAPAQAENGPLDLETRPIVY